MCKGMLMFDLPLNCKECPCSERGLQSNEIICKATNNLYEVGSKKPKTCPLIPVDMQTLDTILEAVKKSRLEHMNTIEYLMRG